MITVNPFVTGLRAESSAPANTAAREKQALQEFERVFVYKLLREMRNTVTRNGLLGDSPAQRMFEEMLDDLHAKEMAQSGQLGLANQMQEQITRDLEAKRTRPDGTTKALPLRPTQPGLSLKPHNDTGLRLHPANKAGSSPLLGMPIDNLARGLTAPRPEE